MEQQPVSIVAPQPSKPMKKEKMMTIIMALIVVAFGVGTGYLITARGGGLSGGGGQASIRQESEEASADEATFRDSAEGVLKDGGISGEGTHHLERSGGTSQYVYLTSTVIDLSSFIDKKVEVWGETISAKKAGWLMDVGKVKVIQ